MEAPVSAPIMLRCKAKTGQHVIKSLTLQSTVDELKRTIESITSIPRDIIRIKVGYPPKLLETINSNQKLESLQIRSGDTLVIDENEADKRAARTADSKMIRKVVPADNSCLFTSVNFVMENGRLDTNSGTVLRELIACVVMSDPSVFNTAYLNQSNDDYCRWITLQDSWGGAIEVAILSKYYSVEICIVDTQTVRIDRFGEDQNYVERVFLIYDGIHYDALALQCGDGSIRTRFLITEDNIFALALELADQAKANRQFTDVSQFKLRCLVCQKALRGQTEAQQHAKETKHINFGEY